MTATPQSPAEQPKEVDLGLDQLKAKLASLKYETGDNAAKYESQLRLVFNSDMDELRIARGEPRDKLWNEVWARLKATSDWKGLIENKVEKAGEKGALDKFVEDAENLDSLKAAIDAAKGDVGMVRQFVGYVKDKWEKSDLSKTLGWDKLAAFIGGTMVAWATEGLAKAEKEGGLASTLKKPFFEGLQSLGNWLLPKNQKEMKKLEGKIKKALDANPKKYAEAKTRAEELLKLDPKNKIALAAIEEAEKHEDDTPAPAAPSTAPAAPPPAPSAPPAAPTTPPPAEEPEKTPAGSTALAAGSAADSDAARKAPEKAETYKKEIQGIQKLFADAKIPLRPPTSAEYGELLATCGGDKKKAEEMVKNTTADYLGNPAGHPEITSDLFFAAKQVKWHAKKHSELNNFQFVLMDVAIPHARAKFLEDVLKQNPYEPKYYFARGYPAPESLRKFMNALRIGNEDVLAQFLRAPEEKDKKPSPDSPPAPRVATERIAGGGRNRS
ncbi:hypothetical protein HZA43_03940 [Candidatus Peregrinibacteria bacterium]|nr:hypothetical protein [Candidatus Peregrinibacteria bacterium]